jgi:hypothetical protein
MRSKVLDKELSVKHFEIAHGARYLVDSLSSVKEFVTYDSVEGTSL